MNHAYMIEAEDIWRIYKTDSREVIALRGLNLRVRPGEFVALKGRSGSGKTTLLNCLGGLDSPTSGSLHVAGEDLSTLDERSLTAWRRTQIGLVFQSFGLLPTLSAYENVELILRIAGRDHAERHARALHCLELVNLGNMATRRPYELSGGQQQRVAIARALANRPPLILADEPTAELDSATSRDILALFKKLVQQEGLTLLVTSHDPLVEEYVDRSLLLKDGEISQESLNV